MNTRPREEPPLPTPDEMREFNRRALRSWSTRFRRFGVVASGEIATILLAEILLVGLVALGIWVFQLVSGR